jgi:hypothetical protein
MRGKYLKIQTELFKERNNAMRPIRRLNLQITDEKELNLAEVSGFIKTIKLRSSNLTLFLEGAGNRVVEKVAVNDFDELVASE